MAGSVARGALGAPAGRAAVPQLPARWRPTCRSAGRRIACIASLPVRLRCRAGDQQAQPCLQCMAAAAGAVAAADPWLALDKLQHLVACGLVTVAAYSLALRCLPRRHSLGVGVLAALLVAGGKELGDQLQVLRA